MTTAKDSEYKQGQCGLENSLLENDLERAGQQKAVTAIKVWEIENGFFVTVRIRWAAKKEWFITTRRNREEPKVYKDLNRLNEHLKEICPEVNFYLVRSDKAQEEAQKKQTKTVKKKSGVPRRTTKRAAKKKASKKGGQR